jgi:RNA polymerase sigma-70 factor (ECF subfamily)
MAESTAIRFVEAEVPEFADLVNAHQAMVFSIAYHFVHDRGVAEELAQDVFLQLHRALPSLQSEAHVIAWLRKVTSHRCIDRARRRKREISLEDAPQLVSSPPAGDPLLSLRLRRIVASLPANARIVIVLRYQEDLGPEEIAQVLGWRVNTVKSQLQRSLAMLREKLGRDLGDVL